MSEKDLEAELKRVTVTLGECNRKALELRHCIYILEAQKRALEKKLHTLRGGRIL